jgi:hypothetical protein
MPSTIGESALFSGCVLSYKLPMKRTIVISVEFEVSALEDTSGLTPDDLAARVYDHVQEERDALVMEARIAAIKLLAGEPLDDSG